MAWIESHQSLARHPKLLRLARLLKVNKAQAIGHLHLLWWWTLDYAPDGDVSAFSSCELGAAAEWPRKADDFVAALREAGWVDADNRIHDWQEYAGRLLASRAKDSVRRRDMRSAYLDGTITAVRSRDGDACRYCGNVVDWSDRRGTNGGTYDHVDPAGPSVVSNLVVCCRGCNSMKGVRSLSDAGMSLIQVGPKSGLDRDPASFLLPNPTQPNPTRPNPTGVCAHTGDAHTPRSTHTPTEPAPESASREIPSLEAVLARAQQIGLADWKARDWFNEMEGCGWQDYAGRDIRRWDAVLQRVAVKWRADGSPTSPPTRTPEPNSRTPNRRGPIDWSKGFFGEQGPKPTP